MRALLTVPSLLTLALLAACQQRPLGMPAGALFALTADAASVPVRPAAKPTPAGPGLTVNLADFLSQFSGFRRVLATLADIDRVVVTVTAADGQTFTQTLSRAAVLSGQTTLAFTGLALGGAIIAVEALDAANQSLARSIQRATVTAGAPAQVSMPVSLASSASGGSGGASGGAPSAAPPPAPSAELAATIAFSDGVETLSNPPLAASFANGDFLAYSAMDVAFGPTGAWFIEGGGTPPISGGVLRQTDAAGNLTGNEIYAEEPRHLVVDGAGDLWYTSTAHPHVIKVAPDGTELARVPLPEPPVKRGLALAPSGGVWIANGRQLTRLASDGTLVDAYPMPGPVGAIAIDRASGAVWITVENRLIKLSEAGAILATTAPFSPVPHNAFAGLAVDGGGHVWLAVPGQRAVKRFGPDGASLGQTELGFEPQAVSIDATGHAWVGGGTTGWVQGCVATLSPQGQLLKRYAGHRVVHISLDASDQAWFIADHGLVFRYTP